MAKYFLYVKVFSRGKGSRVTRAAAYRAGERIRDERTSEVYNYCAGGTVRDDPLTEFTVSSIRAIDGALAAQLAAWPAFREVADHTDDESYFANHCPRCGALQEDLYLHSEPDQPFFSIPRAEPGAVRLTRLEGRVKLSGDESFEV
jgi:hypothetical protein